MDGNDRASKLISVANSSPYYSFLGIKVEELSENYSRLSLEVKPEHLQMYGSVHGGVIASIADSAAAMSTIYSYPEGRTCVTLEMKVNFIAPLKEGRLVATSRVIHKGNKTAVCDIDVRDMNGKLIAKAISTYYIF